MSRWIFYNRKVKPLLTDTEKKPITYIGMTLFSLSFFGALAIRPAITTIVDLRRQIKLLRQYDNDLQTKLRNISRARPIYQRVEEDLPLIEEALPREDQLANLVNALNYHASVNGVIISSIRLSGKSVTLVKGETLATIPLSLQVSGNFPAISSFIESLENSRRQFSLKDLRIGSLSRDEDETMLSATINLETYALEKGDEK